MMKTSDIPTDREMLVNAILAKENEMVNPDTIPDELKNQISIITGRNDFFDFPVTAGQLKKLMTISKIFSGGYHKSSVQLCTERCIMVQRCPLVIIQAAPWQMNQSNTECPIEHRMQDDLIDKYVSSYCDEHSLDQIKVRNNPFIMGLIGELVECYVTETRVNTALAEEGFLIDEVAAMNQDGEVAYNKVESPNLKIKREIIKRRNAVLKDLRLTPSSSMKAGPPVKEKPINQAPHAADLNTKIKDL
jgi:hypothetical protein